jgi:hypothetical protein
MEAGDSVDAVAVAESQGRVFEPGRALDQVLGIRGALQEGERTARAQLDVVGAAPGGAANSTTFVLFSPLVKCPESSPPKGLPGDL